MKILKVSCTIKSTISICQTNTNEEKKKKKVIILLLNIVYGSC